MKTYKELTALQTFEERFDYLKLNAKIGAETFGSHRRLNQVFYKSPEWKNFRNQIIVRDSGCDLGIEDRPIYGRVYIHHLNPISEKDILERSYNLFDPNNAVCVSFDTHQAIHYGDSDLLILEPTIRKPNDTILWR